MSGSSGGPSSAAAVVEQYLTMIAAGRFNELADLYAVDAVVEHPFNPPHDRTIEGRDALRDHFAHLEAMQLKLGVDDLVIHETVDSETVVAEFAYTGSIGATGQVHRRNVFITTVRNGVIVHSRDYQADVG